jgi:hypothetical protein
MADAKHSSNQQSQSIEFEATEATTSPPAEGNSAEQQSLLENVLNETVAGGTPLSSDEWNSLCSVAREYRGTPLDIQPVGLALVSSLLRLRFRCAAANPLEWREMTERIAEALFESPHARLRLEQFWRKLGEATR